MSSTVLSIPVPDSGEIERRITQFADFTEINSPVLEYACNWNAVEQTCEYRCNHLYTFPPGLIADKMNSTRVEEHYVFENFGAGCTAFNIVPNENGDRICSLCEDPNFNPPECEQINQELPKSPDCMTKCNMLPNCTSVCPSVLLNTASYVAAGNTAQDAYADCCIALRAQLNGEPEDNAREQCCRDWQLLREEPPDPMYVARNHCCNALQLDQGGHPPYCASEICHFSLLEHNMSDARYTWVEDTLRIALGEDCVGGRCGVLGQVVSNSDGQLGAAMENNAISAALVETRFDLFMSFVLPNLPFDALLTSETVLAATGISTFYPESVQVGIYFFNAYFKTCNVNAPCKLQEGVLYENLQVKYEILFRGLLASGRAPDSVDEIVARGKAFLQWQDTLPPFVQELPQFAVPPYHPHAADLPLLSAIDHFHSRQAVRRRAYGETAPTAYGPTSGTPVTGECIGEQGLACYSVKAARQLNKRRSMCRFTSYYRPSEAKYTRPEWRFEVDRWSTGYGAFGKWKHDFLLWRAEFLAETERLEQWNACHGKDGTEECVRAIGGLSGGDSGMGGSGGER